MKTKKQKKIFKDLPIQLIGVNNLKESFTYKQMEELEKIIYNSTESIEDYLKRKSDESKENFINFDTILGLGETK